MPKYKEFEVNGAKIGVYPMREVEAVEINMLFKAGSRYENGKHWGAMHLLEHMTFEGAKHLPTRRDLDEFEERNGIANNAFTGGAYMGFWFRFPSQSLESVLKLIDGFVFNPIVPTGPLAREKSVIAQEYRDKWSNPQRRFGREIDKFLFGKDHPYTRDGMGQPEYVNKISAEKLRNLHKKFIVTSNLYIGIAGKVDLNEVEKGFKDLIKTEPKGKKPKLIEVPTKPKKSYLYHQEDVKNAVLSLDWFIPGYDDLAYREEKIISLASYILGGSPLSLLLQKLRYEMGIAYSAGSRFSTFPKKGIFEASTSTNPENINKAIKAIKSEVNSFLKDGVPKSRFYQARKYKMMQSLLTYDSVATISDEIAKDLFYYERVIPLDEDIKIFSSITQKEMLEFLRKYLSGDPYISVMSKKAPKIDVV